jgi:hypothetical protein
MWEAVEKVGLRNTIKCGNTPRPRIHSAKSTNTKSSVVPGLPSNFYNPLWWVSLHPSEKEALHRAAPRLIPSVVSFSLIYWHHCFCLI